MRARAALGVAQQGREAHLAVCREGWILVRGGDGFPRRAATDFAAESRWKSCVANAELPLAGCVVHDFRARSRWISGRSHDRFRSMVMRARAALGVAQQGREAHLAVCREGWILARSGDGFLVATVQDFGARLRSHFGRICGPRFRRAVALDFRTQARRICAHGCARASGTWSRAPGAGSASGGLEGRVDFGARRRGFLGRGRAGFWLAAM